jgi:glucose-6-phosphate isomerase
MSEITLLYCRAEQGFTLDLSQAGIAVADLTAMRPALEKAHQAMVSLEAGAVMNLDEYRRVTHFTDRRTYPETELFGEVEKFFAATRAGQILGATGKPFDAVVINGIGGSALGPQFLQYALRGPYWNELTREQRGGYPRFYCTDNTDPAGVLDLLATLTLDETLVVTISKSGGTRETANNMMAIERAFTVQNLDFGRHAAAVTMPGSKLFEYATRKHWLRIWPMADSIGGRTSETAVVGHVPAAATGLDFLSLLGGACEMDEWTREADPLRNPAYLLAAVWFIQGQGKGDKQMVIVPYCDRLLLLSRYLQQLVMESLGKERDRDGRIVHQGLTVYGNKGGTDAHAYIQQLNDGRADFFITFIEVLRDPEVLMMDEHLSMGDYLHNFLQGLRNALAGKQRGVISITVEELEAQSLGMLIALYERAVAVYAELININAFNQPGVEAYKKISDQINKLSLTLQGFIATHPGFGGDAQAWARELKLVNLEREIEGILAKFTLNDRAFGGSRLRRELRHDIWHYLIE